MMVDHLAKIGGIFSILVFIHFASDWIFQTHAEAMAKARDAKVRARHCAVYTAFFIPFLLWVDVPYGWTAACAAILFVSHFVEDTYIPVFLWMRYVRRPPGMVSSDKEIVRAEFLKFIETPLGKILLIAVDQIIHIAFLLPIAWVVARK